jgi:L-malate glycosyltransferase
MRKTSKTYWDTAYQDIRPGCAGKNDAVRLWIERHIPAVSNNENRRCIEIGCYPGTYLSVFGQLGYELYGIDYCEHVPLLPDALRRMEFKVGSFWKEDFFAFDPGGRFDIVASFGFIEHFENFEEVIGRHAELVDKNGYLVIEVPNFIGAFQRWLHVHFDRPNYDRHHVPAMDVEKWCDVLRQRDFSILYKGYFGEFTFLTDYQSWGPSGESFLKSLRPVKSIMAKILPKDNRTYSPYAGVIAQRH